MYRSERKGRGDAMGCIGMTFLFIPYEMLTVIDRPSLVTIATKHTTAQSHLIAPPWAFM
jgi:hypothetical protein